MVYLVGWKIGYPSIYLSSYNIAISFIFMVSFCVLLSRCWAFFGICILCLRNYCVSLSCSSGCYLFYAHWFTSLKRSVVWGFALPIALYGVIFLCESPLVDLIVLMMLKIEWKSLGRLWIRFLDNLCRDFLRAFRGWCNKGPFLFIISLWLF